MTTLIEIGKALFSCLFAVACLACAMCLGWLVVKAVKGLMKWIRGRRQKDLRAWLGRMGV